MRKLLAAVSMAALLTAPARAQVSQTVIVVGATPIVGTCGSNFNLFNNSGVVGCQANGGGGGGSGTVTSVGFNGGLISVATPTTTPALTVAGTSGGIPYFDTAVSWATSAALAANALVVGGGAGAAPSTVTTGANVLTALGAAINASTGLPNVNGAIATGDCVKWGPGAQDAGAPCAAAPPLPSTGNDTQIYPLWNTATANGALAPSQNSARCSPFFNSQAMHWDQLFITVQTLGTGPLTVALYTDAIDATTKKHQPQTLQSASNLSFTVTSAATVSVSLGAAGTGIPIPAGINWVCVNDTTSTDLVRTLDISSASAVISTLIGSTTNTSAIGPTFITSLTIAQTSGTWPSFAGSTFVESTAQDMPMMAYRVASAP